MAKRSQFDDSTILAALRDLPREAFRERLRGELIQKGPTSMVTAYLTVKGAAQAIDFYTRAFGAKETFRLTNPDGTLGHAQISIGESMISLADEHVDFGTQGPAALGGSPMKMHIYVPDVDAFAARAVAAGGKLTRPLTDQFYGARSGEILDPFGYKWIVSTQKESLSQSEVQRRYDAMMRPWIRPGFNNVTTYLISPQAIGLLEFVKAAFGAEETLNQAMPGGGRHAEVKIGDQTLMIGAGGDQVRTAALHLHVTDVDAVYQRALEAGATPIYAPTDHPYGERGAGLRDLAGNLWYLATVAATGYGWPGLPTLQTYFHPVGAPKMIEFLTRAFGAQDLGQHANPDGTIAHATLRIGTSTVELSEARGEYQPMPTTLYLYVSDADATYKQAMEAGATPDTPIADQPYGDRNGSVADGFGNIWYIATNLKK